MKILVINGPNMNMLGIRQPEIYGHATYEDLKSMIAGEAERLGAEVSFFQSNHEGALVDAIQQAYFDGVEGIILNPAAYTHTSVALLDALNRRKVYAAGLDVLTVEPPTEQTPLLRSPYTRVTGHIAWLSREARLRDADIAIENFRAYLAGHPQSVIS